MQSLPLYTSLSFSIPSNAHIGDIKYTHGICSPTFLADDFLKFFLHPSVFLIKDSRPA